MSLVQDILLSLNADIANVREKKDILTLLYPKIKLLFNTDDIFICFFDSVGETLNPVLRVGGSRRTAHPDYERLVNLNFPIRDGFIDKILSTKNPLIFDLSQFLNPTPFMKLCMATGLIETLSISLHNGGNAIGVLTLWSETKGFFTDKHKRLITEISSQISLVVLNILAVENIKQKDQENQILLFISNEIARIRCRQDLLDIIRGTVRKFIPFDDCCILLYNKEDKTCKAFIYHVEEGRLGKTDFEDQLEIEYPIEDEDLNIEIPVIQDVESLVKSGNEKVLFIYNAGIAEFVNMKLVKGNELIGCFVLLSEKKNSFSPQDLHLLQRLSFQVSIATANIIANEEIEKREKEKTILLSLSDEIAALRNRSDLLTIVNTKLKTLFSIKEFGIAQVNEDGKTYSAFALDMDSHIRSHSDFTRVTSAKYEVSDKIFSALNQSEDPIIFDVVSCATEEKMPDFVYFWNNVGVRTVVGMVLKVGRKPVGCVFLHLDPNKPVVINKSLLRGVCAQLAVAISNILSNEKIIRREEEKAILLSLSTDIASLSTRNDLFKIVNQSIKEIFSISQFGIAKINDDELTHSAFILDMGSESTIEVDFAELTQIKFSLQDKVFENVVNSEDLVMLDMDKLAEFPNPPKYVSFLKKFGFRRLLCNALKVGGKCIGIIFFNIESDDQLKNLTLLKAVCAQLSVAVSNILGHERTLFQLGEINRYKQQLEDEKIYLKEEIESSQNYSEIIGESASIKKIFHLISQVAYSDSSVLILGETGTGKELIARAVHKSSTRADKLMVKVNCATLPANLIESELFGHEKGSFTGAFERRIGKFELANKGTLFLDEIGEMPLDLQVKLLRALQEKEIERIGGKSTIKTDVRIIAATNRDLEKLKEEGKFRSDLYYRLNIFPISLPSLRERREDIAQLTSFFIKRYTKKAGKQITRISSKVLQDLERYDWPGNIRELEHLIERSVLLTTGDTINEIHLPRLKEQVSDSFENANFTVKTLDENEREYLLKILRHVNGKIAGEGGAAELLGIPTSTLNSKIKRLGIKKVHVS